MPIYLLPRRTNYLPERASESLAFARYRKDTKGGVVWLGLGIHTTASNGELKRVYPSKRAPSYCYAIPRKGNLATLNLMWAASIGRPIIA